MGQLYVYGAWPTAVDTNGLCGPLLATSAKYGPEKSAGMDLTIDHPIDDWGKWSKLVPGNLIRASVPMRSTPLLRRATPGYVTSAAKYTVKSAATRAERAVMSAPPYAQEGFSPPTPFRLATLEPGQLVVAIDTILDWKHMQWPGGHGYMLTSALDSAGTQTIPGTRAGVESIIPSPRTRDQLFRIYKVSLSNTGVQVSAQHVSYDIKGSLTTSAAATAACFDTMPNLFRNATWGGVNEHVSVEWATPITASAELAGWTRAGQIEALLGSSNSVASYWNAAILRDNWFFTIITDPEYNSGYTIEYGKNLLGVTYEVDTSDIQSALIPVGQTYKGKPLTVPTGTYTVDGVSVSVTDGIVRSTNDTYPIPHAGALDKGSEIKAAGSTSTQLNAAYVKLIRAAKAKFSDEKCDLPQVTLNVDFLNLGDTAEYSQYRDLQKVFLFDTVRVKHPKLGIDVTTQVNKVEWDCLADRYNSIELGSVRKNYARSKLAAWMVPGLASLQSYVDTISSLI